MITEDELLSAGCKLFEWNAGTIREFYKPVRGKGMGMRDVRLSVCFSQYHDRKEQMVWLDIPHVRYHLAHITTIEQFMQMYKLLTGKTIRRKK